MRVYKRMHLKYLIRKYHKFLLREGMREAARRGLNIQIGLEAKAISPNNTDPLESTYLPEVAPGQIDSREILSLVADRYEEVWRKYYLYQKMLDRLVQTDQR